MMVKVSRIIVRAVSSVRTGRRRMEAMPCVTAAETVSRALRVER